MDWVMEPVDTKTVSKRTVSVEKLITASLPVMKESFLQEKMKSDINNDINSKDLFIG